MRLFKYTVSLGGKKNGEVVGFGVTNKPDILAES
jgi:hypothetical protein